MRKFLTNVVAPKIALGSQTSATAAIDGIKTPTGLTDKVFNFVGYMQNGTTGVSGNEYFPFDLYCNYTATDLAAGTCYWNGIRSHVQYGQGGVAATGTALCSILEMVVEGNAGAGQEHSPLLGCLRYDIGTGYTQTAGNPGRGWTFDLSCHGPVGVRPSLISGVTQFINNYYNGSPIDQESYAFAAVTRAGTGGRVDATHAAATTYPVDLGILVCGTATGGTGYGFTTGIRVGGAGSGWGATSSKFGTAVEVRDHDVYGLYVHTPASTTAYGIYCLDRVNVAPTRATGIGFNVAVTQSQPNASDTNDSGLSVNHTISAASATNELVTRSLWMTANNSLTGGGHVQNARAFNLAFTCAAGSVTDTLALAYLEAAGVSGAVTAGHGVYVDSSLPGTSRSGLTVADLTGGTNNTQLLLGTTTIPSGNFAIYSGSTKDSSFAGPVILAAAAAPTAAQGKAFFSSTQQAPGVGVGASATPVNAVLSGCVFTATAAAQSTTKNTTVTLLGTGVGTKTLPANFFVAGKTVRVSVKGVATLTATTPCTLTFLVKLGSTTVATSAAYTPATAVTNGYFEAYADITCRTTGGSGTVMCQGLALIALTAIAAANIGVTSTAATTVDTTASQVLDVQVTQSNATNAQTVTAHTATVEVIN
jgi:hypothetical protein